MEKKLIDMAKDMLSKAYAPYSHYRVGSVIETSSGKVYSGCNIENMSFGLTICAERTAIFKAISEGERDFRRIVVVSDDDSLPVPCGACLQVMSEFCNDDLEVILCSGNDSIEIYRLKDLFPKPFRLTRTE